MPKANPHRFIAKNEATGLLERIELSDPHKFDHVGRPRPRSSFNAAAHRFTPVGHRPEVVLASELRHIQTRLERLEYLEQQKKSLAERITTPPPPLAERIAPREVVPPVPYQIPERRIQRHKETKRRPILNHKFQIVEQRVRPFFEEIRRRKDDIPVALYNKVQERAGQFNDLYLNWDKDLRRIDDTPGGWHKINRDLKAVGKISLVQFRRRLVEVCKEFEQLGDNWLVV